MRHWLLVGTVLLSAPALAQVPATVPARPVPPPVPAGAVSVVTGSVDAWEQVDAGQVELLLEAHLNDPTSALGKPLSDALGAGRNNVTVTKNFPAQPFLNITFARGEGRRVDPRLLVEFVSDVLGRCYFSPEFLATVPEWTTTPFLGVSTVAYSLKVARYSPFDVPTGLTMHWRTLMWRLGDLPSPYSRLSIAFTPTTCREMTIKAMQLGLYEDAIALANHGLRGRNAGDPTFLYLRAVCEVGLGQSELALATLHELRAAGGIPYVMQERLRGPATVQVWLAFSALEY